ncbi:AMP-binding protein [Algoriphagus vanfongensis]|uniref:AMP-binding protein n=1 Tax=Algoriphagus vanfongensis TaxID=426371 RepID=UPI00040078D0|nr:AMP-binding protein [Algoriphagus vanfongensis]
MFQLIYNNRVFTGAERVDSPSEEKPGFLQEALSFCNAWIAGRQEFDQQTSGSTGTPKIIKISREAMIASAEATGKFFQTNSETTLLCCLNPAYIAGKMMLVRAMVWNCPIILEEPTSNPLRDLDANLSPDFLALVPLQMEAILSNENSLAKIKAINNTILGGAPVGFALKEKLIENEIKAYQTFGMTETVSHIALGKLDKNPLTYETLPGVQIGTDERGCLNILSPMSGPNPIQTNDIVEILDRNRFIWKGRADFVINSGGVKLHPEQLESKAEKIIKAIFPEARYFYIGKTHPKLGEMLTLWIENEGHSEMQKGRLEELLNLNFHPYERPKEINFSSKFVETPSGKINKLASAQ